MHTCPEIVLPLHSAPSICLQVLIHPRMNVLPLSGHPQPGARGSCPSSPGSLALGKSTDAGGALLAVLAICAGVWTSDPKREEQSSSPTLAGVPGCLALLVLWSAGAVPNGRVFSSSQPPPPGACSSSQFQYSLAISITNTSEATRHK